MTVASPAMSGVALMKGGKQGDQQIARILADLCRPGECFLLLVTLDHPRVLTRLWIYGTLVERSEDSMDVDPVPGKPGCRGAGALERRREGEHQLQDYVECEARDLSGEPFTRFMTQLYKRIHGLIARWGRPCRREGALPDPPEP